MKKELITYLVSWLLLIAGTTIEVRAQVPVTDGALINTSQTSKELGKIIEECSNWSVTSPTPKRFKEVNQRLLILSKDEQVKGHALMQLGANYTDVANERLRDDSLANYYLTGALLHLPLPKEKALYSKALYYLGRLYMYPTPYQNSYLASQYLGESFKLQPKLCPEYGDLFLFGWGVKNDIFLASNIYYICLLDGNTGSMDQMNYINYFLENTSTRQYDTRCFEGMEHYIYANFILRDSKKAFYAVTMAAELSLPSAMLEMGLLYANNLAGTDEQLNRQEAFHWFREGANTNYPPAILGLARLCRRNVMDTLQGDIYRKDAKGKYSKEDRDRVNQQIVGLLRRAAEMGHVQAQLDMGYIMMDKPKYGMGAPDYIEAAKWFTAVAQSSSITGERMLNVLQKKMDTASIQHDPEEYAQACLEGQKISNNQQYMFSNTMENILKNNNIAHPKSIKSTPLKRKLTPEQKRLADKYGVTEENYDDLILAINYRNVYDEYCELLKEMSDPSKMVNQSKRRIIQGNMTRLRIYAKGMKYNQIKQSPWEEWNGR